MCIKESFDRDDVLEVYLDSLERYCNKYENSIIMNKLKALGEETPLSLSDIYTDFSLVPKKKFDMGGGRIGGSSLHKPFKGIDFDVDDMVETIDRRIYELNVEELLENKDYLLEKKYLYIFVINVGEKSIECQIKDNSTSGETITKTIKVFDTEFIEKIKNQWVWIRGYEVMGKTESFFIIEPHWFKNEKQLSKKEIAFKNNKSIIENSSLNEKKLSWITSDVDLEPEEKIGGNIFDSANYSIKGMVVLSEPGGGKTTHLKNLVYQLLRNHDSLDDSFYKTNELEKDRQYFPVFIRARDMVTILSDEKNKEIEIVFDDIIKKSFVSILENNEMLKRGKLENLALSLSEKSGQFDKLIIIDGFEELDDDSSLKMIKCLDYGYENGRIDKNNDRLIISSRYKEYGYQRLVSYCEKHNLVEKCIIFDKSNKCVEKWVDILIRTGRDYSTYFNRVRTKNGDINRLITTPLELTGLIILCYSQSALPTDIAILYRSIIEIWLTYGIKSDNLPVFSMNDIFLELSVIAYCMANAEPDRYSINLRDIKSIIPKCREKMRRYYRSNSYVADTTPDDLIKFWLRRNIFVKKDRRDIYEFAHREYQSYLISYAIINNYNLSGERKEKRITYFEGPMAKGDDFWDRSIVFSAFMSTDIRDDIVDYIFAELEQLDASKTTETIGSDIKKVPNIENYYLSILLQLINAEGFYFEDEEYEKLYNVLFSDISKIRIMRRSFKGSEIGKMLLNGRKTPNTIFLKKCVESLDSINNQIKELKDNEKPKSNKYAMFDITELDEAQFYKNTLFEILPEIVFNVIWSCEADYTTMKKAFKMYLGDRITNSIIYKIRGSIKSGEYIAERIQLIEEICKESIENEYKKQDPKPEGLLFLAIINSYLKAEEEKKSLFETALFYFQKSKNDTDEIEKKESLLVATNIILLCTWFLVEDESEKCGCSLKSSDGNWNNTRLKEYSLCIDHICDYMKTINNNCKYDRDIFVAYKDLCCLRFEKIPKDVIQNIFNRKIFKNCLEICEKRGVTLQDKSDLSYISEIIALYPLENDYVYTPDTKMILEKRIDDIEKCMERDDLSLDDYVFSVKLLILAGRNYDNMKLINDKLKKEQNKWQTAELSRAGNGVFEELKIYFNQ